jgi:hypothetical protein
MEGPSIQRAQQDAIRLAKESGLNLAGSPASSLEELSWVKKGLYNRISVASQPGSSIGKKELRALVQTKSDVNAGADCFRLHGGERPLRSLRGSRRLGETE